MLQHATREVPPPTLPACIEFYALLGLSQVPTPSGIGDRAVWLAHDVGQIHLMPVEGARAQSGHVGLVVSDYEQRLVRLRAAGHDVDPRREHWGSPRAYVRDPAGNLVELMASAPGEDSQPA
ncbi:MAG: hypothetical protein M3Z27_10100 [Actinomycetota bacterium]|nr:hypothetical protein [Actinomycetota bacterium]